MKIQCEKCKDNLFLEVSRHFDQFEVGRVKCKNCQKESSRYISESDILLYLGLSEILYLILSVITLIILYYVGIKWIMLPIFFAIFGGGWLSQRLIVMYIYNLAPMKQDYKNISFNEDVMQIKRSNNWQFILFFALAITAVTGSQFQLFFLFIAIVSIVLTFVKFFLCIKKERKEFK